MLVAVIVAACLVFGPPHIVLSGYEDTDAGLWQSAVTIEWAVR